MTLDRWSPWREYAVCGWVSCALLALAPACRAQEDAVRSDEIGAGYAQLVNIALSEDLSSARYELAGSPGVSDAPLRITRFPFRLVTRDLAGGEIDLLVELGYLDLSADFSLSGPGGEAASVDSRWRAYGGSVGARYRYPITGWLALEPSLWLGASELENDADYSGFAEAARQALDGVLFNWETRAVVTTADLGLVAVRRWGRVDTRTAARVTHSRIESFDESSETIEFRESTNTLSLRSDLEGATGRSLRGHAVSWTVLVGYSRFFGDNDEALGFNGVVEVGAGLVLAPKKAESRWGKVALYGSLLRGDGVDGWSFGIGLRD